MHTRKGGIVQTSKRRKKILEIFVEKGPLSYEEILDETSELGDPADILSDIDILVFFKFLQNVGVKRSELTPDTLVEMRPETGNQMQDNPLRINSRLTKLEHEFPPWYRKLAVLKVLDNQNMACEEIINMLCNQFPLVRWHPLLTMASLRILKKHAFVSTGEKDSEKYTLTHKGGEWLEGLPIQKFLRFRKLKDEFTNEFRTIVILDIVRKYDETGGISSRRIIRHLQSEYGIRGNNKRAVLNTLNSMVLTGLLVSEGNVYHLSKIIEYIPLKVKKRLKRKEMITMNDYHSIQDFKETVEQFFDAYEIPNLREDIQSSIRQILYDLEQCNQDLSLRSPDEWLNHIVFLSSCLQEFRADTWGKGVFRCIIACVLSRLLLSEVSIKILLDYPPPFSPSKEHRHHCEGIAREYYFNLTEIYLDLGENEKAFQSFNYLKLLSWESFEFFILEGTVEMKKGTMSEAINTFERAFKRASKMSKEEEKIVALFHIGLAHYQRGDFTEAEETWERCLKLKCTVNQEIIVRHNLANAYRMSGESEKAKKFYEDSIAFAERYPQKEEFKTESYVGLANILIDLCLWEEAERTLEEVIQECTEKGFSLVLALAETNFGVLLGRKGRYEEALAYHERALDRVDKGSNPQEYSMILTNKGDTLRQLKRVDEALTTLKEAHELVGSENQVLIQIVKISLADVYVDIGDFDKSWELAHSVLQERWLGNRRSEAEAQRIQGIILLRKNEFQRAKESLEQSERILNKLKLKYELLQVYKLLEVCYRRLKNEERETHYRNERETLVQQIGLPGSFL